MNRAWVSKPVRLVTVYVPLALFLLWTILPIYWIAISALKSKQDLFRLPIEYLPSNPTLDNLVGVLLQGGFYKFFVNSFIVSGATTLILILIIAVAGYGYSRFRFRGQQVVLLLFLATQLLPEIMIVVPLFVIFRAAGLLGTHWSLIIAYVAVQLPFSTFLMIGFYQAIPRSLDEAALIDGCNRLQALFYVILPLVLPGLAASATFAFINGWNELLFALMFINNVDRQLVPPMLVALNSERSSDFSALASAGVLALIPVILIFAFTQKYLTGGLTAGGVKG